MPRKGHVAKREVLPDPLYNSTLVTKLVNSIMLDGKKGVADIMPVLKVKSRRVGGATYQVPMDIRPDRRRTLGLRWLTLYSRKRGEKTMEERLAGEILDALNNAGGACKKKEETHKMAEANKAFSHYKW